MSPKSLTVKLVEDTNLVITRSTPMNMASAGGPRRPTEKASNVGEVNLMNHNLQHLLNPQQAPTFSQWVKN